jgi:hypothetical protein
MKSGGPRRRLPLSALVFPFEVREAIQHCLDNVETNIDARWAEGIEHHPESVKLYAYIAAFDWVFGDDFLELKQGDDADNGEHLMYLLDIYFEMLDSKQLIASKLI